MTRHIHDDQYARDSCWHRWDHWIIWGGALALIGGWIYAVAWGLGQIG